MTHYRRHNHYFLAQKMKRAQEEEEAELEEYRRRCKDSSQDSRLVFFKPRKRKPYWK
jgi:hypothetical protein